jgi:hypothetical protein
MDREGRRQDVRGLSGTGVSKGTRRPAEAGFPGGETVRRDGGRYERGRYERGRYERGRPVSTGAPAGILAVALILGLVAARGGRAADAPSSAPTTAPTTGAAETKSLDGWVAELGSPSYARREAAAGALTAAGRAAYAPMRKAFRAGPSYEVKRRICLIAHHIFINEKLGPPRAFLGIQLDVKDAGQVLRDPPPDTVCVTVEQVIAGTAAQSAGLRRGDIIIGVDGELLRRDGADMNVLQNWINRRRPGTKCVLWVVRNQKRIEVPVTLGERPYNMPRGFDPADGERFRTAQAEFWDFWRSEFDPDRTVDFETPSADDPNWRVGAGAAN